MQDLKALETRKIALYRRLNALALELPESIHSDIITHCDAYIQALTKREAKLSAALLNINKRLLFSTEDSDSKIFNLTLFINATLKELGIETEESTIKE